MVSYFPRPNCFSAGEALGRRERIPLLSSQNSVILKCPEVIEMATLAIQYQDSEQTRQRMFLESAITGVMNDCTGVELMPESTAQTETQTNNSVTH
jgi:hypothetical protein